MFGSVTKKLKNRELKRTLARRQETRTSHTQFDEAVPLELHVKHLLRAANTELSIRQGKHTLSPFLINLKQEPAATDPLLEEEMRVRLNLLHPALERTASTQPEPIDALTLNTVDIFSQLQEDGFALNRISSAQLPQPSPIILGSIRLPNQKSISLDAFLPRRAPEDLHTYFDLPEEEIEEPEESDLVEFEQEELQIQTSPASSTSQASFPFPLLLRPVGAFVLISFAFVLPLHAMNVVSGLRQTKNQVESVSQEAFSYLKTATSAAAAQENTGAAEAFSQAGARFSQAQKSVEQIGLTTSLLLAAIPQAQTRVSTGTSLLSAGEHLTTAGSYLTQAMEAIKQETDPTPVSRIRLLQSYLRTALPHLTQAQNLLAKVDLKHIPSQHQATLSEMQARLPAIVQTLTEFEELSDLAVNILGGNSTKRYLLIFQNNTEIRATGGFMGSFAELKVRDGIMENLSVPSGGTYDLQGLLRASRIAPEPLRLINARWEFQDANWFPDFPTSARQMIEFYRDAGGPSVDGVIAINATYVADLIGLLGPIDMPDYERTIDAENFLFEAQKIVELEYDRIENKPKQFIGDLAPKLVERALEGEPEQFLTLVDHLSHGLTQKDIQLYFADEDAQRSILAHHWGGAVEPAEKDYLMLVNSNLGGGKTDGVIQEDVDVSVEVQDDGSIINTVTVKRTHHGLSGMVFSGVNNVNYMRLYVPKGSTLIDAQGFRVPDATLFESPQEDWIFDDDLHYSAITATKHESSGTDVYEEHGKSVFGNWVLTAPGETWEVRYRYQLPFNLFEETRTWPHRLQAAIGIEPASTYSLTIQKQAGTIDRTTTVSISLPEDAEVIWKSHDLSRVVFDNSTDAFLGLLLR